MSERNRTEIRFDKSIQAQTAADEEKARQIREDSKLRDLMEQLLVELKINNFHNALMTDDDIKESDIK